MVTAAPSVRRGLATSYRGFTFRSRLEARYAVFWDELRISWQYEPDGFDVDGTRYVPDFWLPDGRCWIEVKPTADDEAVEAAALLGRLPEQGFVAIGMPGMHQLMLAPGYKDREPLCMWGGCSQCGGFAIVTRAWGPPNPHPTDGGWFAVTAKIDRAAEKAEQAYFERPAERAYPLVVR